jgi:peptidylprolyl isomerase
MMNKERPNKTKLILAVLGCLVALFLVYDYFHPVAGSRTPPEKLITTPSGLQYADLKVGTGPSPQPGHQVTVHYVGTLTDGSQFDSSREKAMPFTFTIGQGQVIKGWDEGVLTMKVGGLRKLVIPPALGYGTNGTPGGSIPPNATLNFEVELLSIK